MNKSIAVIRHIGVEGLGTIEDVLKNKGLSYDYIDTWKDTLPQDVSDFTALVILGGPMGVYEQDKYPFIEKELELIRKARNASMPVIGICLGSQMIAQALGGRVYKGRVKEIGWYDINFTELSLNDKLFASIPVTKDESTTIKAFQWHGDTYDLPEDAIMLASSKLYANQAFRIGTLYGLQFHIEVKEDDIENWINEYKTEVAVLKKDIDLSKIMEDTRKYIGQLNKTSIQIFSAFFTP